MERCIRISLSEYIDPDQSQRFDHSGQTPSTSNEIWREPFSPARTCDTRGGLLMTPCPFPPLSLRVCEGPPVWVGLLRAGRCVPYLRLSVLSRIQWFLARGGAFDEYRISL